MKKLSNLGLFIAGFLCCLILVPSVYALSDYLCKVVEYPVYIDGVEYSTEKLPLLNYEGNTYAPLRSILETAGLTVKWDDATSSVMIATKSSVKTESIETNGGNEIMDHIPSTKLTPDGIKATYIADLGVYVVYINSIKGTFAGTDYSIYADDNGIYSLYKNGECILDNIQTLSKHIGVSYDYYCNTIYPLIS